MTFITVGLIIWIWITNRKRYHNLKHQIPAYVVKNYLDSIIQNSSALKSSLFRGGGLDVDPSNIPSVMPIDQLQTGSSATAVNIAESGGDEALKAEVARLQSQLAAKDNTILELETKNSELNADVLQKQARIEELEALLAEAGSAGEGAGGADEATQAQLVEVTAERDKLKEDLAQYEIIEDDLADLKRLRQENEQLKASIGGGDPIVDSFSEPANDPVPGMDDVAAEVPVEDSIEPPVEEVAVEEPAMEEPVVEEAVAEEAGDDASGDDKSPEDLLSEFEKMLG